MPVTLPEVTMADTSRTLRKLFALEAVYCLAGSIYNVVSLTSEVPLSANNPIASLGLMLFIFAAGALILSTV